MNLNIMYDPKTNTGTTRKVVSGGTNYYVGLTKICANCGKAIIGYPAISRQDNKTEICSNCGSLEAIEEFMKYKKESLQALLEQYYQEEDTKKRNILKQKIYQKFGTNKKCFRCENQLLVSDLKEYKYLCLNCDENFYEFEVM